MMQLFVLLESGVDFKWALSEGVTAMVAGMGTVFIVLIVISYVISLLKHFNFGEIKHEHKEARINVVVEEKVSVPEVVNVPDDLELIAVITAAIAASMNTTTDQLQVKSYRRISSKTGLSR